MLKQKDKKETGYEFMGSDLQTNNNGGKEIPPITLLKKACFVARGMVVSGRGGKGVRVHIKAWNRSARVPDFSQTKSR